METSSKWMVSSEEKKKLISLLTPELVTLRARAEISQDELATVVGISRQTYGAIERGARKMSWNTYLSLILFFDYNQKTHTMLRGSGAFPQEVFRKFNDGSSETGMYLDSFLGSESKKIMASLDEQALNSIRTMIMLEYARCTSTPGEVVVKSFNGIQINPAQIDPNEEKAHKALQALKEKKS